MKPQELAERRRFDFRVINDMRCAVFAFEAYRTSHDLRYGRNQVTSPSDAGGVSKYKMTLRVPTLSGPGSFVDETVFGVDLDVADYPKAEPLTWLISDPIPWSPHFLKGRPICLGREFWVDRKGYVTLGHLVIHVAMMLNWDEPGRPGYVGWNGEAIKYHAEHYQGRPLHPGFPYPDLPDWVFGTARPKVSDFTIIEHRRPG
jgi:hypothetical protein